MSTMIFDRLNMLNWVRFADVEGISKLKKTGKLYLTELSIGNVKINQPSSRDSRASANNLHHFISGFRPYTTTLPNN
jgi:hypothetical protein